MLSNAWWGAAIPLGLVYLWVLKRPSTFGWLALQRLALAAGLHFVLLVPLVLALSPRVHITQQIQRVLDDLPAQPAGALEYHEDSLVFATRGTLKRLGSIEEAIAFTNAQSGAVLIVPAHQLDAVRGRADYRSLGVAGGFNYSKGRQESLEILQKLERESEQ